MAPGDSGDLRLALWYVEHVESKASGRLSKIEWTEETWNPVTGCDRVSRGCDRCYAMAMAKRLKAMGVPEYQNDGDPRTSGPGFGVTLHWHRLEQPFRWRQPCRIFVNSMSDLFHARVPFVFVEHVWRTMEQTPRHTYQILTKRPDRMARFAARLPLLPNVWLGTSIEDGAAIGRIEHLLLAPAAIRFVSAEPLLEPVSFSPAQLSGIDWLIAGGESQPGCRPCELDWLRALRDQCRENGVAFFLKQLGGHPHKRADEDALLDGRAWKELPTKEKDRTPRGKGPARS